jgi:hypothetical protein
LNQVDAYLDKEDVKEVKLVPPTTYHQRVLEVVKSTGGGAMETLGKWFSAPEPTGAKEFKNKKRAGELNPFTYIFSGDRTAKPKKADLEDYLKDHPSGMGEIAILEFVQWWWIQEWDQNVSSEVDKKKKRNDIHWDVRIADNRRANLMSRLGEWKKESRKKQRKGGSEPNT